MRGMNSETVDLIATDPPFNKGRDFHATPDKLQDGARFQDRWSWERDVHQEWVDQIKDDYPRLMEAIESARYAHSDGMGAFMCFMSVRLLEMKRILKPTGNIYLHCDPTASHYLRAVMDAIFGRQHFVNEIVWHYDGPQRPSKRRFGSKHDTIFRYAKTANYFSDPTGIAPFQALSADELSVYKKLDVGRYYYTTPRGDYTDKSIERLTAEDRIEYTRSGKVRVRHFLPVDSAGRTGRAKQLPDVWTDIVSLGHAGGTEKAGYPTQKPLALYERIIKASSNLGDLVLDPFCGCATTCVAAERLERQWTGIDIWDGAHDITIERLQKEGLAGPQGNVGVLTFNDLYYETEPAERTDNGDKAIPFLPIINRLREPLQPWQRLSRQQIIDHLTKAQSLTEGLVTCAGCGREMESPFMELDHITPRADRGSNDISNRILLCRPCNGKKSDGLTMRGLLRRVKKDGWMQDETKAKWARSAAQRRYEKLRYEG